MSKRNEIPPIASSPNSHDLLMGSSAAKQVFDEAENFAQIFSGAVYPLHLFYAGLLTDDELRDATLAELNVEKKHLLSSPKAKLSALMKARWAAKNVAN